MKKAMVERLVEAVKNIVGEDYEVKAIVVKKNNGVKLDAVNIRKADENVTPTIYIQRELELLKEGKITVKEAAKHVLKMYEESKGRNPVTDVEDILERDFILQHVEYQLVNKERNIDRVNSAPHKDLLDLAVLYRVVVEVNKDEIASYVLSNDLFERIGVSIEELDEAAARNTESLGFVVKTMAQVVAEMMGVSEDCMDEGPQMYVLTNERKINGANILMNGRQLATLADKLNDDFYILPSSIHEALAVPASSMNAADLKQIVKDVNDTEVQEQEILGYSVYRYNRETGTIEVAA